MSSPDPSTTPITPITCDLSLVRMSRSRVNSSSFLRSPSTSRPRVSRSASSDAIVCARQRTTTQIKSLIFLGH